MPDRWEPRPIERRLAREAAASNGDGRPKRNLDFIEVHVPRRREEPKPKPSSEPTLPIPDDNPALYENLWRIGMVREDGSFTPAGKWHWRKYWERRSQADNRGDRR